MGQLILLPAVREAAPVRVKRKRSSKARRSDADGPSPSTSCADNVEEDGPHSSSALDEGDSVCDECARMSSSSRGSSASVAVCQTAAESWRMARKRAGSPTASSSSGSAMSSFTWFGVSTASESSGGATPGKRRRHSVAVGRCADADSDGV